MMDAINNQYTKISGLACFYELQVRLEADVVDELNKYSHEKEFSVLEEKFLAHYDSKITEEQKKLLIKCRQLRNKIIHSDFKSAQSTVLSAGKEISPDKVHQMKISDGSIKSVQETTKKEGGIFGWLLEASTNGTFLEAENIFKESIAIVRKLGYDRATSVRK